MRLRGRMLLRGIVAHFTISLPVQHPPMFVQWTSQSQDREQNDAFIRKLHLLFAHTTRRAHVEFLSVR